MGPLHPPHLTGLVCRNPWPISQSQIEIQSAVGSATILSWCCLKFLQNFVKCRDFMPFVKPLDSSSKYMPVKIVKAHHRCSVSGLSIKIVKTHHRHIVFQLCWWCKYRLFRWRLSFIADTLNHSFTNIHGFHSAAVAFDGGIKNLLQAFSSENYWLT